MPVGTEVVVTNSDGSITITQVVASGRQVFDLRIAYLVVAVMAVVLVLFWLAGRKDSDDDERIRPNQ